MEPETFGARLRRLRLRKGLSVRQLEDAVEVAHGVISRLENHTHAYPSMPVAKRLATVLGVSLDYLCLMDYDGKMEPAAGAAHGDVEDPSGSTVSFADNGAHSMAEAGKE